VAVTTIVIAAPRERVFEVLATPAHYGDWVVGTNEITDADPDWPAVGSRLRYATGVGPLEHEDRTKVVESIEPELLELDARVGKLGHVRVRLQLEDVDGGTRVVMTEEPASGVLDAIDNPASDAALAQRNAWSLERLKSIAEAP